jgi:rhodanese-related sulfurtransferase
MARKRMHRRSPNQRASAPVAPPRAHRPAPGGSPAKTATIRWPLLGIGMAVVAAVLVGGFVMLSGGDPAAGSTGSADDAEGAAVVQGVGGGWSEITVDDLDARLDAKDFTLLNVKTPYIGEIEGTDLYVPYDRLTARADELPADKDATIVVYCRTGNQSATAAQTLIDLGYTDVVNVDGGMTAWAASGREIVQRDRS